MSCLAGFQCVCQWKGTHFTQAFQKSCRLQGFLCNPNFPSWLHQFCSTGSVWIPIKSVGKEDFHWDGGKLDRGLCQISKQLKWVCWHLVNLSHFLIKVSALAVSSVWWFMLTKKIGKIHFPLEKKQWDCHFQFRGQHFCQVRFSN